MNRKVVHIHLFEPYRDKRDWYFGSTAAVFDHLPYEVIGVKFSTLTQQLWEGKGFYRTRRFEARVGELLTKQRLIAAESQEND